MEIYHKAGNDLPFSPSLHRRIKHDDGYCQLASHDVHVDVALVLVLVLFLGCGGGGGGGGLRRAV